MKEVVSDLNIFSQKRCKNAAAKKVFFTDFRHLFTPVKGLFSPLPEVQCPISFRYLESLGKSNGKKWSQIVKLLLIKGLQLPRKKNVFLTNCVFQELIFCFMVIYQMSPVTSHLSPVTCHLSPVTCHSSPVTCNLSPVTCHPSLVTGHLTPCLPCLLSKSY